MGTHDAMLSCKVLPMAAQWKLVGSGKTLTYSGLICNCSPRVSFEEVDDEEDDGSNCK